MKLINLLGIGLTGLGAVALAFSMDEPAQTNVTSVSASQVQEVPSQPPRHKITVTLTSPDDLKVKEGQRIKLGDVISDRTQARQKLEAKKKQSKFLDPFLSEIHEPERIKELAQLF